MLYCVFPFAAKRRCYQLSFSFLHLTLLPYLKKYVLVISVAVFGRIIHYRVSNVSDLDIPRLSARSFWNALGVVKTKTKVIPVAHLQTVKKTIPFFHVHSPSKCWENRSSLSKFSNIFLYLKHALLLKFAHRANSHHKSLLVKKTPWLLPVLKKDQKRFLLTNTYLLSPHPHKPLQTNVAQDPFVRLSTNKSKPPPVNNSWFHPLVVRHKGLPNIKKEISES